MNAVNSAGVLPATGDGTDLPEHAPIAVKEAVLPFHRFRTVDGHGVDTVLSPEMKAQFERNGAEPVTNASSIELERLIRVEFEKYSKVIKAAKINPE